jgi:predicted nucleic acid-binding protein
VIVVDASALVEALFGPPNGRASRALLGSGETLLAPHLIDIEVAQVIRRLLSIGQVDQRRAGEALSDLADFPLHRSAHTPLLPRIWALRHNLTAYDAAYVALAEALDARLLTCDARLASAPGHTAHVELI